MSVACSRWRYFVAHAVSIDHSVRPFDSHRGGLCAHAASLSRRRTNRVGLCPSRTPVGPSSLGPAGGEHPVATRAERGYMLIGRNKTGWALYFPGMYLALAFLTFLVPTVHGRDQIPLWALRSLLLVLTVAQARFLRRSGASVTIAKLFRRRSVPVTGVTRIVSELRFPSSRYVRSNSRCVFWIVAADGCREELGTAAWTIGGLPDAMGRNLASILSLPLAGEEKS